MTPGPKRILLLAPQPFYQDRGTPIAVRHVLRALSELGMAVDVLTFPLGEDIDIPGVRYLRVGNTLRIRQVPIGFSWRKVWFDLLMLVALRRQLRRERYAWIHAVEEAAFLAVLAARRARIPVLYDMQSSLAEQMGRRWGLRGGMAMRILMECERWLLRRVDVVGASAGLEDRVARLVPETRVIAWRYPNHLQPVSGAQVAQLRQELNLTPGQPMVVYTGSFEEYQGLPLLIHAIPRVLSRIPEAVFVFVGADGPSAAHVERLLASHVPSGAYRLLVRQPQALIRAFLAAADVAVSPRIFGGNLPIKIMEYLAAGCAIVATDLPAHRSVLTEELAMFAERTVEGFAEALTTLLTDPVRRGQLRDAARAYADTRLGWVQFVRSVQELYCPGNDATAVRSARDAAPANRRVSIVIPARNAGALIARVVGAVLGQQVSGVTADVLVVDDGSTDDTADAARAAGAQVVTMPSDASGNPAAARNSGARRAAGEILIFLDADCTPAPGWLAALLARHDAGEVCVGGSLDLPPGLSASARWDYYCGWYHVHSRRPRGPVRNHPPCNVSIQRELFLATGGFTEQQPIAYSHEELAWQADLQCLGHRIYFEPSAVAFHWNRSGMGNLLRRNFRWAYSAIESKAQTGIVRLAWLYDHPWLLVVFSLPLGFAQAIYITACWVRGRMFEPLAVFPVMAAARLAYGAGMMVGGWRWLTRQPVGTRNSQPRCA